MCQKNFYLFLRTENVLEDNIETTSRRCLLYQAYTVLKVDLCVELSQMLFEV